MSCIFCNSLTHSSQYCNIFISDNDRKNAARSRKLCVHCLKTCCTTLACIHGTKQKVKCYICFSKNHHSFYCPDRFTMSKFFIPNIDTIMLPRFMMFLNFGEQYTLAFSSPEALNCIEINSINVMSRLPKDIFINDYAFHGVVTYSVIIEHQNFTQYPSFSASPLRNFIFKAKLIILKNSRFSSNDFYSLISQKTVDIFCDNVRFTSSVTFSEILKKSANIKYIYVTETKIGLDTWPNDLGKIRNTTTPLFVRIAFNNINQVDPDVYVNIMKAKSVTNVSFYIKVADIVVTKETKDVINAIILERFNSITTNITNKMSHLRVAFYKRDQTFEEFGNFVLK